MLVMKLKNLYAKLIGLALLGMLFIAPAVTVADTMNDYVTDYGLIETYAQTAWPSLHRDSRNSDFAPFVAPTESEVKWKRLDGAAVLTAVTIGPEGNLYVTTGQEVGHSNLHAFDREGNYLWSSEPVVDINDLDAVAVGSSAIVDSEGDVYISDANQFWAFRSDGTVKWVVPIPANFTTAAFTVGGYVGGITRNGEVVILDRDDGSSAALILDLPGGAGPPAPPAPPGIWGKGQPDPMVDPLIIDGLYAGLLGLGAEVTNTPAVNPVNNRIYIAAAGPTPMQGRFYGIDFTPGSLTIAFQTPMGPGSGTSPAISPDGSRVYAADGGGNLYAFDADTGASLWLPPFSTDGQALASPSISPEGIIYLLGGGLVHAIADRGTYAELLWSKDFDWLAPKYGLYPIPRRPPQLPLYPTSKGNSVISVTPNHLYVTANLGYEIFLPVYQKYFFIPKKTVLLVLDPADGSVITDMALDDTCDGVITIGSDGSIYITHGSTARSFAYYTINPNVSSALQVEPPIGGISALEPLSFLDLVEAGIHWVQDLDAAALGNLDVGGFEAVDEAYTQVRRGVVQLGATANSIGDAEGEIGDGQSAQQARQRVNTAQTLLDNAKNHLAQWRINPNDGLLVSARELIENTEKQLEMALEILPGSAAPPLTSKMVSKNLRLSEGIPLKSGLVQNYPNPFNPETWLPYQLAKDSDVIIKIYNVSGQLIRTLNLGNRNAGFYLNRDQAAYWDGRDGLGEKVASGIYFYTLRAGDFSATRRMVIMK